jgi:inner membrane protein
MFVAHSFAGYLCSRHCLHRFKQHLTGPTQWKYYLLFGVFCSVLPDFDLLYFYTIDNRQHLHHSYWTHIPIFWVIVAGTIYGVGRWIVNKRVGVSCVILLVNTLLHLVLDTIAGGIYWFYPLSDMYVQWLHITPRYSWWVLNYIFHWTFFLEICIILAAVYTYSKERVAGSFAIVDE